MNGYNTGWKFDGWYDAPQCLSSNPNGEAITRNSVGVAPPYLGGTDPAVMAPNSTIIMTHGYNAIRLRFAVTAPTPADCVGIISWQVFLLESDNEEDQTASMWMATPFCAFLTQAPSGIGATAAYSQSKTNVLNWRGKSYAVMSNQVRVVQSQDGAGTEPASDIDEQEYWASQYFYNAVGLDVRNGQATIDAATGLPTTNIINRRFSNPAFSPGFGTNAASQNSSGELYINNLAGAARIIIQPRLHLPYTTLNRLGTPVATNATVNAKSVGVFYNLLQ